MVVPTIIGFIADKRSRANRDKGPIIGLGGDLWSFDNRVL